jgi:predicted transcriptional regulator
MGTEKLDLLPVVSRANTHNLLGVVILQDVLHAFGVEQRDSADLSTIAVD